VEQAITGNIALKSARNAQEVSHEFIKTQTGTDRSA
jgi:hypothetical protein